METLDLVRTALPEARIEFKASQPLPVVEWRYVCQVCDSHFTDSSSRPVEMCCIDQQCDGTARAYACLTCESDNAEFDDDCAACYGRLILSGEHTYSDACKTWGQVRVDRAIAAAMVQA